jgi:hypothetical protein
MSAIYIGIMEQKDEKREEPIFTEESTMGAGRIFVPRGKPQPHPSKFFPDGDLSFEIIGKRGTGKSTILTEIIPQIGTSKPESVTGFVQLSQVFIFTLIPNNPVNGAIKRWCEAQDPPILYKQYDSPAPENIADIEATMGAKPEGSYGLFIFDDFVPKEGASASLSFVVTAFKLLRNEGYYCCIITQDAISVNTKIRNNANIKIVFRMNNIHAVYSIARDFESTGLINRTQFMELYTTYIMKENHAYLMLCQTEKKDAIFISCPEATKGETHEVVIKGGGGASILEDANVKKLVSDIQREDATPYDKKESRNELIRYLKYLSKSTGISIEDYIESIQADTDIY